MGTKFIDDPGDANHPPRTHFISLGMVAEDGREFYAEGNDVDWSRASDWVLRNVKPRLLGAGLPRTAIRDSVLAFVGDDKPEFWGYYSAYGWVVFCGLFGRMVDLPEGWPDLCLDIKQLAISLGNPPLPKQTGIGHHALADAHWNREAGLFLERLPSKMPMLGSPDRPSVMLQGVSYDHRVIYYGQTYWANVNIPGTYHSFGETDGHRLLNYCRRCSDPGTEGCLGERVMATQRLYLEAEHFVS
jgi:hypothetical protein